MTAAYICIACGEPIQAAEAVIVGVDIAGYPDKFPTNVVACRGCEDKGRAVIRRAIEGKAANRQAATVTSS